MKRFFVFMVFCRLCIVIGAVPAKPIVKDSVLSDGSVVRMVLRGDEYGHYYEQITDNRLQITDSRLQIADYRLQIADNRLQITDSRLQITDYRLQIADNRLQITDSRLQITDSRQQIAERRERALAKRRMSDARAERSYMLRRAPHQAERGLVILVEFSDVSFVKSKENFDDLLNKEGYDDNGATGSARDYFRDASNGQYIPQFDLYGPYKLNRVMEYYGQNDKDGIDMHPDQMVVDAVAMMDSIEDVNFADYDTDNDGRIDNIFIYYAGYGENEGAHANTIWPHAWEVLPEYVTGELVYDGKRIGGYACASELQGVSGSTMTGIGTFCHEFGHVLGLPDFYVTDDMSAHRTLGCWSIMDYGSYLNDGNTPPTYSAHERFYLGWLTPEILSETGDYELEELQKSNKAYIITETGEHNLDGGNPNSTIYYLLENRQQIGWDAYLPGHGLMITKTMYDEETWYNNVVNNNKYMQGYDIIEADGKAPYTDYGKPGDLFPGSANVTSYAPYEHYKIVEIAETDSVISFSFVVETNVAIDDVDGVDDVVIIKRDGICELVGVWPGVEVRCIDAVGRQLWRRVADDDTFEFVEPEGFYLLQVTDGEKSCVVKGVRN